MKKHECTVCGYVHEGDKVPEKCPACKSPASRFIEDVEEKRKAEIRRIHARMYNSEREQASSGYSYDDSGAYGYPADRGPSYRP